MHLKPFAYLSILLTGSSLKAAILHPLNDLKVIEVPVSRQGLTRITVQNDRIQNVFGVSGEYVLEADETHGQVFIRPLGAGNLKAFSLTLTTEKGHTQDLRLDPQDKEPEALILKAKDEQKPLVDQITSREEVEDIIKAAKNGRIPLGYKIKHVSISQNHGPHKLLNELVRDKLCCLTYEVKNKENKTIVLTESTFAKTPNTIAVMITNKTLKPQEGTIIYVVKRTTH